MTKEFEQVFFFTARSQNFPEKMKIYLINAITTIILCSAVTVQLTFGAGNTSADVLVEFRYYTLLLISRI